MRILFLVTSAVFVFALPLFFSFQTNQIFEVNKFFLFTVFTALLSFLAALEFFQKPKNFLPVIIWLLIGIFLFFSFLAHLLAKETLTSFYGGAERHQGFFLWVNLILLFLSFSVFRLSKREIEHFIFLPVIISGFLVSLLAVLQSKGIFLFFGSEIVYYLGFGPFGGMSVQDVSGRSFATLGQPNFLGQFLIFPVFIGLYFLLNKLSVLKEVFLSPRAFFSVPEKKLNQKKTDITFNNKIVFIFKRSIPLILFFFALVSTFFCLWALWVSGARGAILGVIVSVFLLFSIFFISRVFKTIRTKKIFLSFVLVSVFILGVSCLFWFFLNPEIITQLAGERGRSIMIRFLQWKEAFNILLEHLFFGVGFDQLDLYFDPRASFQLLRLEGFVYTPDKAHNIFIDLPLQIGILGAIAFFVLIGFIVIKSIFSFISFEKGNQIQLFIPVILLGVLVSWFFGFPVITDFTYFFLFLSLLVSFLFPSKPSTINGESFLGAIKWGVIVLVSIWSVFSFVTAVKTFAADKAYYDIQPFLSQQSPSLSYLDQDQRSYYIDQYLEKIEKALYLDNNIWGVLSSPYIDIEKKEQILLELEQNGSDSKSFFFQKAVLFFQKGDKTSGIENLQIYEKKLGNHFDSLKKLFHTYISIEEYHQAERVGRRIYKTIPIEFYEYKTSESKKFWKHHTDVLPILDFYAHFSMDEKICIDISNIILSLEWLPYQQDDFYCTSNSNM